MLGIVFAAICLISFVFAVVTGRLEALSEAVAVGAAKAVTLTISLVGLTGLWCGVMRVFMKCGLCRALSRFLSPLLRILFPDSFRSGVGNEEIAANISANLLGLGNADTPFGIKAMEALSSRGNGTDATDDMVTFVVLNTSSVSLMPTTLIALRSAAGSEKPFEIITAVWICSFICMCAAMINVKAMSIFFTKKHIKREKCR